MFHLRRSATLAILAVFLLSGCSASRIGQFRDLSDAGTAYAKAVDSVLTEAGTAAIDADTALLVGSRDALDRQARAKNLMEQNALLKERLQILEDLKRHTALLKTYFETLASLSGSSRDASLAGSTKGIVSEMGFLRPRIADMRLSSSTIGSLVAPAVRFAVLRVRSNALEAELEERGSAVERELALQKAALSLIAQQMRVDLQVENQLAETQDIILPFAQSGNLPNTWKNRRREVLRATLTARSAEAAAEAAEKLHKSFLALAEGRTGDSQLRSMSVDVDRIGELLSLVNGGGKRNGRSAR